MKAIPLHTGQSSRYFYPGSIDKRNFTRIILGMSEIILKHVIAFEGHRRIAAGSLHEVALEAKSATEEGATGPILIFDDATGRVVDLDPRGIEQEVEEPRGPGRPKLGVIAREVTLLPRHW